MRVFVADFLAWNLSAGLSSESKVVEVEVDVEKEREREGVHTAHTCTKAA